MDGMNEDPSDEPDRRFGADPRQDWIGEIAESEGITRDEVVEQLVSSSWTLKEMHGLMETAEEGIDGDRAELPIDIETLSTGALADDLEELHERIERLEAEVAEGDADATAEELQARVQMLMDRVNAFEESITERQAEITERQEQFAERQADLLDRFDEEFENLETILEYLIETSDTLEEEIGAGELKERLDRGEDVEVIDVREPFEWRIFNLGDHGARLIPLGQLENRLGELDPHREIVFYCRSGSRSWNVMRFLRGQGWDRVRNLRGGILAWGDEVDPSVPRY